MFPSSFTTAPPAPRPSHSTTGARLPVSPSGARGASTVVYGNPFRAQLSAQTSPRPSMGASIRPTSVTTAHYEPRIIRANVPRTVDTSPSLPTARGPTQRRPSIPPSPGAGAGPPGRRASASWAHPRRPSLAHGVHPSSDLLGGLADAAHAHAVAFAPPAYLDHSALRHFLHTDTPSPPSAVASPIVGPGEPGASSSGPPLSFAAPWGAREPTPMTDSDEEGSADLATTGTRTTPAPVSHGVPSGRPVLRLPTVWSEQDRNPALSVSANGRDLSYHGTFCCCCIVWTCSLTIK